MAFSCLFHVTREKKGWDPTTVGSCAMCIIGLVSFGIFLGHGHNKISKLVGLLSPDYDCAAFIWHCIQIQLYPYVQYM